MQAGVSTTTLKTPTRTFDPTSNIVEHRLPSQWLLELETDGTVRYSNIHPHFLIGADEGVIGSSLFDLRDLARLDGFERDFAGFVKSGQNRQTFRSRHKGAPHGESVTIVLTRSFDTTETGTTSVVILMEVRAHSSETN